MHGTSPSVTFTPGSDGATVFFLPAASQQLFHAGYNAIHRPEASKSVLTTRHPALLRTEDMPAPA